MVALAPPLRALLQIQLKLQSGISLREALHEYSAENQDCLMAKDLEDWLFQISAGQKPDLKPFELPYRKLLIEVLARGMEGEPILKSLETLEEDMIEACRVDMENQLQKLPLKTMIPLLFLQLPAFLILVFGPLLFKLINELSL